jgi:hypothetical protein
MQYSLISMTLDHLPKLAEFAEYIYANAEPDKYPDFKISNDIDDTIKRKKFFSAFVLPSTFNNYNIRQCYVLVDENGVWQAAVGVKRWAHMPSWSLSWLLSPNLGVKFISIFRTIITELSKVHEAAGMNEFYVSYPAHREAAYSKVMLPVRENYYSFVECTIAANTRSHYSFIHELMGHAMHPHDMNLRRYILRRENTEAESQGGIINRKSNK